MLERAGADIAVVLAAEVLAGRVSDVVGQIDHAAAVAGAEWTGPHRDTFDGRVALLRAVLLDAANAVAMFGRRVSANTPGG